MIIEEIYSHPDFEFIATKERKIKYYLKIPDNPKGIVFFISGFGDDVSLDYRKKMLDYISDNFELAAVTVDYHAIYSRPEIGASPKIPIHVEMLIRSFFNDYNTPLFNLLQNFSELRIDKNIPLQIPTLLLPANDEYQNFGILPAVDHIYTLYHIQKNFKLPKKVVLIGSSYGGYIANLITKFAPSSVSAVFDNSSWAKVNMKYINGLEFGQYEFGLNLGNFKLVCSTLTPWTHFPQLPNYFDDNKKKIREFPLEHLKTMAENGAKEILYRYIHSYIDTLAPTNDKLELVNGMKSLGFDVNIEIIEEKDVDGKFIKNLNHGMNLSLKTFFTKYFKENENRIKERKMSDFEFDHKLSFDCPDVVYSVDYRKDKPPIFKLKKAD